MRMRATLYTTQEGSAERNMQAPESRPAGWALPHLFLRCAPGAGGNR
jgi:hypothetical protein